jgi:putative endonuclease
VSAASDPSNLKFVQTTNNLQNSTSKNVHFLISACPFSYFTKEKYSSILHTIAFPQSPPLVRLLKNYPMLEYSYYVYILANKLRTVLYTGVTNSLGLRVFEHYQHRGDRKTFTGRYNCNILVYYEGYDDINLAIQREKEIKGWTRKKKEELIQSMNPRVENLYLKFFGCWPPRG